VDNETCLDPQECEDVVSLRIDLLTEATEQLEMSFEISDSMFGSNANLSIRRSE